MKSRLSALILCVAWSGIASAAVYFNNSQGDNSYTNDLNWNGPRGTTGGEAVNLTGADQPYLLTGEVETSLRLWIANNAGTTGEMTVDGGDLTLEDYFHIGYGGNGTLHMNSGSVEVGDYIDVGSKDGATGTLNMNGGTMETTIYDIDVGAQAGSSGILNMSGGHLTAYRWFQIGESGTGVMTMSGGTNTVILYDVSLGKNPGSSGTLNMYGGYWDVTRDFIVAEDDIGVMTMTNGLIEAGGVFRVSEVAGSAGQLNFSGGTIYASDLTIGAGTKTNGMVAFSGTAKMILPGNKVSKVQGYIDAGYLTGADVTYITTNDTTLVGEAPPLPPQEQLPAGMLARFDFENSLAGDLIPGTDPAPRPLAGRGSTFDYVSNGADSNTTLSVLREFGPGDFDDNYAAYVCEDTLHNNEPGGQFMALSPFRVTDAAGYGDIDPSNIASNDYFQFSIQANSNLVTSLDSFSFDMASYMATNDVAGTNLFIFGVQSWYAVPDGGVTNWVKMQEPQVLSTTNVQDWVGFTNVTVDLSGIPALQAVAGEILIALALADNNNRATHIWDEEAPAEYYLDNINLYGTVAEYQLLIAEFKVESGQSILSWDSSSSYNYNVLTNIDLVSGGWGITDTVPGLGGDMSWTSAVLSVDNIFYKIGLDN